MRFLHTSDWQIGRSFGFADDDTLPVLQDQRLEAISRIGRLARAENALLVLVAGDVWDSDSPGDRTLRQPIERMRQFPEVRWHLIPGNHDPHVPGGTWDRLRRDGVPPNVLLHLTPEPVPLGADAAGRGHWLLPAVLDRRHAFGDPTAPLDGIATPEGDVRIGLAHGSARAFGSEPDATRNLIASDRAERAGLRYLALGDWHGCVPAGPRAWYSGTPEPDGFDRGGDGDGNVLLVDGAATPVRHPVGRFSWHRVQASLFGVEDIVALEHRLRALDREDPSRVLCWLAVDGALRLDQHESFLSRIRDGVGSALRALRIDDAGLQATAVDADLAALGVGAVRDAAAMLQRRAAEADGEAGLAAVALQRLLLLARREGLA